MPFHHRHRKSHYRRRLHHSSHERKVRLNDGILAKQQLGNFRQPVPERLFCALPFASVRYGLTFTALTGVTTWKIFCANNPYDPDPAIGGASAAYFAENGLNYENYICFGSRIRVYASQAIGAATSQIQQAVCGVTPLIGGSVSGNPQLPANYDALLVSPQSKWKVVSPYDAPIARIDHEVKVAEFTGEEPRATGWQGVASGQGKNPSGAITGGTSPIKQIFWGIGIYVQDPTGDNEISVYAEIDYFTEFQSPVTPYYYEHTAAKYLTVDVDGKVEGAPEAAPDSEDDPDMSESVMVDKLKAILKKV